MSANASNEAFRYTSRYDHGVDDKRRVQIPAKWRPELPETEWMLILWEYNAPDAGSCVRVYTPKQMEAKLINKIEGISTSDEAAVALRRMVAENSEPVVMDKAGRICIPEKMATQAGLGKDVVLAGAIDWFEVWNPDRHKVQKAYDAVRAYEGVKKYL